MLSRHYRQNDIPAIDKIIGMPQRGDVRLDRDRIICIGNPASGLLVWRPGGIIHELHVGYGPLRRNMADSLLNFGLADAISRPFNLQEGIFVTDDDSLANYIQGMGAVEETGKRVFTFQLR
jgi:hypothetical protein